MTSDFGVGVHALVYLNHKREHQSSEQLAENICTNPARVRKIMAQHKKAGLVETREGGGGGYFFTLSPERVSLRQVADALEVRFVSVAKRSGDVDRDCQISSGMGPLMDGLYEELDRDCRARLQNITIKDIDRRIFEPTGKELL